MATKKWRYVEFTYYVPGEEKERWGGIVTEADSPKAAMAEARESVERRHPGATKIEEFMQRTISEEKANEIKREMGNETWNGWEFPGE